MLPELGQLLLTTALGIAIAQVVFPLLGYHLRYANWIALSIPFARAQFVLLIGAFLLLMQAFIVNDFSVQLSLIHI